MALVKFHKVTTLPATLEANAFYYVENGTFAESYITNSAGVARSVGNTAMINALIDQALADFESGMQSEMEIVPDIAARDALAPTTNKLVLVIDASADATVSVGSATYAWRQSSATWIKIAEYESMDVVVTWANINDGPSSSPAQIDSAVSASHTHANKTTLDALGTNTDGLTLNGTNVSSVWATNGW
ncbi:hypothetical protein SAMN05216421_1120 [Halopseudomonas xinjiangensis]|uniref:Uncharacterized protein n=1 Tax=Halopseudomonas xinjiangensis TaxID=487184 RepID=A0A1H1QEJ2_9GAMM|nr:hypothetical protein [Halopseudomonas xinjiangensis]SDS21892.1 hypothetical protein SAMN05216421_1120 [Halopseudomonas xinjiangensis]